MRIRCRPAARRGRRDEVERTKIDICMVSASQVTTQVPAEFDSLHLCQTTNRPRLQPGMAIGRPVAFCSPFPFKRHFASRGTLNPTDPTVRRGLAVSPQAWCRLISYPSAPSSHGTLCVPRGRAGDSRTVALIFYEAWRAHGSCPAHSFSAVVLVTRRPILPIVLSPLPHTLPSLVPVVHRSFLCTPDAAYSQAD